MSVTCLNCGTTQIDDATRCSNCGAPLRGKASAKPPGASLSREEVGIFTRYVLRYTLLPVLLVAAAMCVAWLICSNLLR